MMEKFTITICGIQLSFLSDEPADLISAVAEDINGRMSAVVERSHGRISLEAALLCALDVCTEKKHKEETLSQLSKSADRVARMTKELKNAAQYQAELEGQLAEADKKIAALEAEIGKLKAARKDGAQIAMEMPGNEDGSGEAGKDEPEELFVLSGKKEPAPVAADSPADEAETDAKPSAEKAEATDAKGEADAPKVPGRLSAAKLKQVDEMLRRQRERGGVPPQETSHQSSASREEKLRQIEALLQANGGGQSLSEALGDAGK